MPWYQGRHGCLTALRSSKQLTQNQRQLSKCAAKITVTRVFAMLIATGLTCVSHRFDQLPS